MRLSFQNYFLASLCLTQRAYEVGLRSASCEEGRLLAHLLGGKFLQAVNGWILTINIVTQRRRSHGIEHFRSGKSHRITPKIDYSQSGHLIPEPRINCI